MNRKFVIRNLYLGLNLYFFLLLVEFITTLFSTTGTGTYVGFTGLVLYHTETDRYMVTAFGMEPFTIVVFLMCVLVTFLFKIYIKNEN